MEVHQGIPDCNPVFFGAWATRMRMFCLTRCELCWKDETDFMSERSVGVLSDNIIRLPSQDILARKSQRNEFRLDQSWVDETHL